ncbi:STAS domain-containing protein [Clostridium beijerinckii]|uniref:RsbT co-antagonist protein RsbR n=1 Tax=Clostridium beijerinckii TaxID=1520 RepID=A0A1B9BHM9_CLOBE|nr:STAS domain-containing protein [Clostridium beijerinckii]AQS07039.1 RsbT co-antagonist protein RsbRA [Clostridium beijerinckii]MBA2883535.1 rsbT co-antagonist protein RsbR [Clostridium beijerinckii]MBA2898722.1 rsbT co-antagonist protein RsbR [Clostridium beijerinckii]MBA2908122.1 rsbT co-antagonist protein RsbR [Clostridium beijerinckii]MBA9013330.1 rsbT co-antagonist protein RsbR [Clostridium beijerinckii]
MNNMDQNSKIIESREKILEKWLQELNSHKLIGNGIFREKEIEEMGRKIFNTFLTMLKLSSGIDWDNSELIETSRIVEEFSKKMATRGQTPTVATNFIYSLKSIIFEFLQDCYKDSQDLLNKEILRISDILDKIGLHSFNYFVHEREEIIKVQQEDMMELSTPVIKIWDGILAVPLIGTLDSKRTQLVMEKLLETIVNTSSKVAIVDITGVGTVDTLVANHLIKTAAATKLIGAEIIITGISPVIAQTVVHLGVDLSGIITRAIMEDGIKLAMEMCSYKVVKAINNI